MFIKAEVLFHYEHGSNFRIADGTFDKLIGEVSNEDYSLHKASDRLCCEQLMAFIEYERIDFHKRADRDRLENYLKAFLPDAEAFADDLFDFLYMEARLPSEQKNYIPVPPIEISIAQSRQEIIDYLQSVRSENATADLAFYAYRDMDTCDWAPFVKAALERNPVSIEETKDKSIGQICDWLNHMPDESIYEGNRLAQPDEVANFGTGDGIEKAILLADIIASRQPQQRMELTVDGRHVVLKADAEYTFTSNKSLAKRLIL